MSVPVLGAGSFFLAAYQIWPMQGLWYPENYSEQGQTIDFLSDAAHVLCAVILIGTGLVLAWSMWRFRESREGAAKHVHHNRTLEITWSVIPGVILIALALFQYQSWEENRLQRPQAEIAGESRDQPPLAKVYAKRFGWEFHYAGPDQVLDTEDDIYLENLLIVPQGENVVLQLESYDVIHSFFVPRLRLKHDIIPGMTQFTWFKATEEAEVDIFCTELCGWGHYAMQAKLRIVSPSDFRAWMQEQVDLLKPKFAEAGTP